MTLEHVAALVRRGEPLRVVDSESGQDLTAATLAQILSTSDRARARLAPEMLADLIRGGKPANGTASMPRATRERVRRALERLVVDDPLSRQIEALEARVGVLEAAGAPERETRGRRRRA